MLRRRVPRRAVERVADGYALTIGAEERDLLRRMLGELRDLLSSDDPEYAPLLRRLFPPAYLADEHHEAEADYQRFMREELVASRLSAISAVEALLGETAPFDESTAMGLLQSLNNLRLVLGTMLDVGEEHDPGDIDDDDPRVGEHHLYTFLSWLVNELVEALSGR